MKQTTKTAHQTGDAEAWRVPVRFDFTHPTAAVVAVAGSFNNGQPSSHLMHDLGNGHWQGEAFLPPGTYEYCLVVDGHWRTDPRANDTVSNPFGGRNSLLTVVCSPEATHRADAETLPLKNANKRKAQKYE